MAEAWQNPYRPGAATIPPTLAGRDDLLGLFAGYLRACEEGFGGEYLIVSGHRGMGKTVLLYAFRDLARERGWLAQRVEATDEGPFLQALAAEAASLLERLEARAGLVRRARQAVEELTVALGVGPAKVEVKAKRRAAPALDVPVTDLVDALGTAAKERKVGAVLLLDEVQAIAAPSLRALGRAFQAAEGERLPVLLAAGGLPNAPGRLRTAVSYAERYRYVTLEPLGLPAVRGALVQPAEQLGVSYEADALDLLVAASEGYPYLVQLLGRQAWEAAGGADITLAHAQVAVGRAHQHLADNVLGSRWARATPKERAYLTAMATLGPGAVHSGEIARTLGQTAQTLSPVRQNLIDKGIIVADGTRAVQFAIPGFRSFVLEEAAPDVSPKSLPADRRPALPAPGLAEPAHPEGLGGSPARPLPEEEQPPGSGKPPTGRAPRGYEPGTRLQLKSEAWPRQRDIRAGAALAAGRSIDALRRVDVRNG